MYMNSFVVILKIKSLLLVFDAVAASAIYTYVSSTTVKKKETTTLHYTRNRVCVRIEYIVPSDVNVWVHARVSLPSRPVCLYVYVYLMLSYSQQTVSIAFCQMKYFVVLVPSLGIYCRFSFS